MRREHLYLALAMLPAFSLLAGLLFVLYAVFGVAMFYFIGFVSLIVLTAAWTKFWMRCYYEQSDRKD